MTVGTSSLSCAPVGPPVGAERPPWIVRAVVVVWGAKGVDLERRPEVGAELEPAADMFLVYLRVFAEKCGLLDFLKLFVFSLASRKPPGEAAAATPEDDNLEVGW